MSFTRKHYDEAARIIREERDFVRVSTLFHDEREKKSARVAIAHIASRLSAMFASDNPKFDAERFAKACEPKGE